MRNVAQDAYEEIMVGETGWMKPNFDIGETLQGFQQVAYAATVMQKDGLIYVLTMHRESATGHRMVNMIQFTKLR